MFLFLTEEPGRAFKSFLPDIIALCIGPLLQNLTAQRDIELKRKLHLVYRAILLENWRYDHGGRAGER